MLSYLEYLPNELISQIFIYVSDYDNLIAVLIIYPEYMELVQELVKLKKIIKVEYIIPRRTPLWKLGSMRGYSDRLFQHELRSCPVDCEFCKTGYYSELSVHHELDYAIIKYQLETNLEKIFSERKHLDFGL